MERHRIDDGIGNDGKWHSERGRSEVNVRRSVARTFGPYYDISANGPMRGTRGSQLQRRHTETLWPYASYCDSAAAFALATMSGGVA